MMESDTRLGLDLSDEDPWAIRNGWLMSVMWLVFMVFPLFAALGGSASDTRKIGATVLFAAFCGIYVIGFHRHHLAEQEAYFAPETADDWKPTTGTWFLVGLIVVATAAYGLVGIAALGVVPFVVSFAAFNLRWSVVVGVLVAGVAATTLVPLAEGTFGDIWFLWLVVLAVGGANVLIRFFTEHQVHQHQLLTGLAISDERGRVARDVHDILGHSLTAVILKAELCQRLLDQLDPASDADRDRIETCRHQLAELHSVSRGALAEIRSTVGGLRAANLVDELTVARTVLADGGVGLLVTGEPSDVPEAQRQTLAWVVREAVTNVVRHSRASSCHIELAPEPGRVLLRISDDGVGLGEGYADDAVSTEGNGLRGLRERVEILGARLRVTSDDGTRLEVTR